MDIKEKIINVFSSRIDISSINENDELIKMGIDSLDLVEAMIEIEEEFNVEFTSEEISNLKTLKDVYALLENKVK